MSDDVGRAVIADLCRIPNPESIDRTAYVDLGGVSQFVSIRGRSTRNPVLVVCHGGPALPSLPSSWVWQRGVEDYFTVVNYDQRASLLWAYVGVGQVISGPENEEESFRHAMRSAVADRNEQAISELRALGEYPGDEPLTVERIVTCRRWAQYYGGLSAHRSDFAYFTESQELSPYYTDADLGLIGVGQRATMPAVLPALLGFGARDQTAFEVPMLQFLGRHDWTTPTGPVARWLETVTAPSTHVVWFENSAHLCMFEEPGKFLVSLVTHALPYAVEAADARKDGSTDSPLPA